MQPDNAVLPNVFILDSPQALASWVASLFAQGVQRAIEQHGRFAVAMAGGATPRTLYSELARRYTELIPWEQVFLFWGDERFVPHNHPDSNYRMVHQSLISQIAIPQTNLFPIPTNGDPAWAAQQYERTLREFFDTGPSAAFDLVLLGMGTDGHTASLFPFAPTLAEKDRWVAAHVDPSGDMSRITLTPQLINQARQVVVMVTGEKKASRLAEVLKGERNPARLPIQSIKPVNGTMVWAVDAAAATKLSDQCFFRIVK